MDAFIAKHADKLQGTLLCFDRVLFRGYLPFFSAYAMASFLESRGIYRRDVKRFVLTQAYRLKDHALLDKALVVAAVEVRGSALGLAPPPEWYRTPRALRWRVS